MLLLVPVLLYTGKDIGPMAKYPLPSKPPAKPQVSLNIARVVSGVELSIERLSAQRVAVSVRRPPRGSTDWLDIARVAKAGTAGASAKAARPAAGGAVGGVAAPAAGREAVALTIEAHYRSTAERAAMVQACLFQPQAEQPYLFHSGKTPWYSALPTYS